MKEEFTEQAKALAQIHGDVLENINTYGAEFRAIINDFLERFGKCPTAADLLWIASEHAGRDITEGNDD